jgi:hypothetical protein
MLIRCCNPECKAPFNYREGRLIRFSRLHAGKQPAVEHFWLCGTCAREFVFEGNSGTNVKIKPRSQEARGDNGSHSASAA